MTTGATWWSRGDRDAFGDVESARACAMVTLEGRPDTCAWQTRAAAADQHVTAYCLIEEAIDRVQLALSDERFDGVDPGLADGFGELGLTYLYDTYACWAEQLLREIGYLLSRPRDRSPGARTFDRYVNSVVKHRNEGKQDRGVRAYGADHHLSPLFIDFEDTMLGPGFHPTDGLRVMPSLVGVSDLLVAELCAFDRALQDDSFRASIERDSSRQLSDLWLA